MSISPACCGQLVKMLITLEPHEIFGSIANFALFYFDIVQPLVCKTVMRVCQASICLIFRLHICIPCALKKRFELLFFGDKMLCLVL